MTDLHQNHQADVSNIYISNISNKSKLMYQYRHLTVSNYISQLYGVQQKGKKEAEKSTSTQCCRRLPIPVESFKHVVCMFYILETAYRSTSLV